MQIRAWNLVTCWKILNFTYINEASTLAYYSCTWYRPLSLPPSSFLLFLPSFFSFRFSLRHLFFPLFFALVSAYLWEAIFLLIINPCGVDTLNRIITNVIYRINNYIYFKRITILQYYIFCSFNPAHFNLYANLAKSYIILKPIQCNAFYLFVPIRFRITMLRYIFRPLK